jgi:hypothetical protein
MKEKIISILAGFLRKDICNNHNKDNNRINFERSQIMLGNSIYGKENTKS